MRVIGGKLRGKLIYNPTDKTTRPLKDMVRESIFNILEHSSNEKIKFKNDIVLDLFSGSGSFGIECLSRGANSVTFFENYINSLKILKKNILNLKLENKCNINNESAYNLENSNLNGKVFKIIFLDPPFKDKQIKDLINQIKKIKIADKNSLLIIHRNRKSDDKISEYLNILEHKNYGLSKIFFCSLF